MSQDLHFIYRKRGDFNEITTLAILQARLPGSEIAFDSCEVIVKPDGQKPGNIASILGEIPGIAGVIQK